MATIGTFKKNRLERVHRRDRHSERPGQGRPHRPRPSRQRRKCPQPPRHGRSGRNRSRLVEALQRRPALSRPQARRSELQRPHLRQPLRRRRRRDLLADLVSSQRSPWRLTPAQRPRPTGRGLSHDNRISCLPIPVSAAIFNGFYSHRVPRTTIIVVVLAYALLPVGGDHA